MEIPEEYTVTHRDEPFLLYNNGIDSPARILIFSTETNLRALTTSISNTMTKQKIITTTLNQQILWSMVYLNTIPIRNLSHRIKNGNRENRQPVEPKSVKQHKKPPK
jgi:hypothetical protein